MAQDDDYYPETEIEVVQSIFDSAPHSPVDLFEIPWPPDPNAQSEIVRQLMNKSQDKNLDWGMRMKAYDFLNARASEMGRALYLEGGPPKGIIVPELVSWCVLLVSGLVEEPKRGPGRDPNERFMRNLKIRLIVKIMSENYGRSQEYSIGLITFVTGEKEGTVKSGLRAINDFFKEGIEDILKMRGN